MPRLMAVSLTEPQVRARAKTVTRRAGWRMLRAGDQLTLCRKVMGRRRGEPLERIAAVEVTSVRRESLDAITAADVAAEGFPQMTPAQFMSFFCRTHRGCGPNGATPQHGHPVRGGAGHDGEREVGGGRLELRPEHRDGHLTLSGGLATPSAVRFPWLRRSP